MTIAGRIIYHAGDTDLIPEMQDLGRIDLAFLPVGGTFVMDIEEAAEAALVIRPRFVVPMHQAHADVGRFSRLVESESPVVVKDLQTGEAFELPAEESSPAG